MSAIELNLEGLPGPTHNFAGLAVGNLASEQHRFEVSSPRRAALESLEKMRVLYELGVQEAILPPHPRPDLATLRGLGFDGTEEEVLTRAQIAAPDLFAACYSSSAMWTANAATVSPAADSGDQRIHFTPANLTSQFHRALETPFTAELLRTIFPEGPHFTHHDPLVSCTNLRDEGAANHLRLATSHGKPGLEIFVWGDAKGATQPQNFRPRQTLAASQAIARLHGLGQQTLFLQQNPDAIDLGVFHNDVISVSHGPLLLAHEDAFAEGPLAFDRIREAFPELVLLCVSHNDLSMAEAVSSYLFNSQLVDLEDGTFALVTPQNVADQTRARVCVERIMKQDNPISRWIHLPLDESMKNGGGPACLRLRVAISPKALSAMHQGVRFTPELHAQLVDWVERHYRDELSVGELQEPALVEEAGNALGELYGILGLGIKP